MKATRDRTPIPNGTRFVVVGMAEPRRTGNGTARQYKCACDCGNEKIVVSCSLKAGKTQSCGCLHKEILRGRMLVHGHSSGSVRTPEHSAWHSLRQRCNNPSNRKYQDYGGKVCERWNSFSAFFADMGVKPSAKHSVGRINNDGDYCPDNCRWETPSQQANNCRSNRLVTFKGKTLNIKQWSREVGISYTALLARFKRGWDAEVALTVPAIIGKRVRVLH